MAKEIVLQSLQLEDIGRGKSLNQTGFSGAVFYSTAGKAGIKHH